MHNNLELPPPREDTESPVSDDFDFDIPDSMNFEQNGNGTEDSECNTDMQMSVEQKKNIITPPSMPADVSYYLCFVGSFCTKGQLISK